MPLEVTGEDGLAFLNDENWMSAVVPGELHLDLLRHGRIPEPTVDENMRKCRWPEAKSWWFKNEFIISPDFLEHDLQCLICDGLDLYAQLFLNGRLLGTSRNAFVPVEFDVRDALKAGENSLIIRLTAGSELAPAEMPWGPPGGVVGSLDFPQKWTLFGPFPKDFSDHLFCKLSEIPATIVCADIPVASRAVSFNEDASLDLAPLLNGVREGRTGLLCTEIRADEAEVVTFSAAADWWMKWWLNGQVVCDTTAVGNGGPTLLGEHCFNLSLRPGRNLLIGKVVSGKNGFLCLAGGPRELRRHEKNRIVPNPMAYGSVSGHRMWPAGVRHLRKPQFSYGWDWVEALPNIGIWRGVHLEGRSHAVFQDLRVDTILQNDEVSLEVVAILENPHPWSERFAIFALNLFNPENVLIWQHRESVSLLPGRQAFNHEFIVPEAQLWWPNGMGGQPLYRVEASLQNSEGKTCDHRTFQIGLRTIAVKRTPLPEGTSFHLLVNGERVFCRGGNVGAHDAIIARVSPEKNRTLMEEARAANLNMLRLNGCWIYEDASFFDACDRAGILVWQDFLFSYNSYPDDLAAFYTAVRAEVEAIVPRLRHHASLAVWCGSNEMNWGFRDWWNPDPAKPVVLGGMKITGQLLPEICRLLDPRRPYWLSSPAGGESPNSELHGDCHWWGAAMSAQMEDRVRHEMYDRCRARFVSEYGSQGPCHPDSIREFITQEKDRVPTSLAWRMHVNTFERSTVAGGIAHHYVDDPEQLGWEDFSFYGQLFQAVLHGGAMEAQRFRKDDPLNPCGGSLFWSYSDAWGETGWSILDYYMRRKAAFHAIRRACRPVKIIVRQRGNSLVTRLVNDTLSPFEGKVCLGWYRLDGSACETSAPAVSLAANSMCTLHTESLDSPLPRRLSKWIFAAVLYSNSGAFLDHSTWQGMAFRHLAISPPNISVKRLRPDLLELVSPVYCHGVRTEDGGRLLLSDNWFDLLPDIPKLVRVPWDWPANAPWRAVEPRD